MEHLNSPDTQNPELLRQHKTVIKALANGINSISGEILPENGPHQNEELVAALLSAAAALEVVARQRELALKLPRRSSSPWSADEDKSLIRAYDQLISIEMIADRHRRTEGAIRSRLAKLLGIKTKLR